MPRVRRVWIRKVPHHLKDIFNEAVKAGVLSIGAQHVEDALVHVYDDYLAAPLKNFFDNLPNMADQGYHSAVHLAEEAYNEAQHFVVHTVGDPVVHGLEDFENTVSREAGYFANTVSREAGYFANTVEHAWHDVGGYFSRIF